ncbi:MAG TPA: hypothetical protein DCF33_00785 [Saprospirales bacterium]|nr:hypothetical protein [Saprospirales bacterium]
MKALFWILLIVDLLLAAFTVIGKNFRRSFTASDPTFWFTFLVVGSLIAGILLRLSGKKLIWALAALSSPILVLLLWYLVDTFISPRA